MADHDKEQRTEQPTARRRREARQGGQIAKSRDLTVAFSLLATFACLGWLMPQLADQTFRFTSSTLSQLNDARQLVTEGGLATLSGKLSSYLAASVFPIAVFACLTMVLCFALQGVWVFLPQIVLPQWGRVAPLSGLSRLLAPSSVARGIFAALKLLVVGLMFWFALAGFVTRGGFAASESPWVGTWENVLRFALQLALALVVLGAIDYGVQRWFLEGSLRMTRAEVREEALREDGNQSVKARRRAQLRERREPLQ